MRDARNETKTLWFRSDMRHENPVEKVSWIKTKDLERIRNAQEVPLHDRSAKKAQWWSNYSTGTSGGASNEHGQFDAALPPVFSGILCYGC